MGKRNVALLKERMRGRWVDALVHVSNGALSDAASKIGSNVVCPIDGRDKGFRFVKETADDGYSWKQHWADEGHLDPIKLLMEVTGKRFTEVFDELVEWLEGGCVIDSSLYEKSEFEARQAKKQTDEEANAKTKEKLNKMWAQSVPLSDDSAVVLRKYLYSRGVLEAAMRADNLRFCEKLAYYDDERKFVGLFPAMIALVRDNRGYAVQIHRTYLDKSGEGRKLNLGDNSDPRKSTTGVHGTVGRSIHLAQPDGGVIGVAEGIETALAVTQGAGVPVWSCVCASFMTSFVPPKGVHTVIIFVDVDRSLTGEKAADRLQEKLESQGISVIQMKPELQRLPSQKSVDWLDQYNREGKATDLAISKVREQFALAMANGNHFERRSG